MNHAPVTPTLIEFVAHREEVMKFIRNELMNQGLTKLDASMLVTEINFWPSRDVENLYRCINSDMEPQVIKAIVAHDFNGIHNKDVGFLPKSHQFERSE